MAFETVLNKSKESKIKYFLQLESGHHQFLKNIDFSA